MAKGTKASKPTVSENTEGTKTIILIAVLLVLIVFIGGALFFVIMSKGGTTHPPPPVNNTNQTVPIIPPKNVTVANSTNVTPICDDQCHLASALKERNFSECQLVHDASVSQNCYLQLSNESLDACKALSDQGAKDACLRGFALNDSALCGLLPDALKKQCTALSDACSLPQSSLCQALKGKDPGRCGSDFQCVMNYSTATGDASACSKLKDIVQSKACSSVNLGTDQCSDLTLDSQKNYCYELYAIYSDKALVCTQINGDNVYSLDCVSHFAAERRDLSICDSDSLSLNSLWACYINYSLSTGDLAGCVKIDALATTNKYTCSSAFAQKFGDPTACQLIVNSLDQRSTCYQGAILYYNQNLDWTKCAGITNQDWKSSCYTQAAKLDSNVSLCDLIDSDYGKQGCRDSYALYKKSTNSTG